MGHANKSHQKSDARAKCQTSDVAKTRPKRKIKKTEKMKQLDEQNLLISSSAESENSEQGEGN